MTIPDALAVEINTAMEALHDAWLHLEFGAGSDCDPHFMVAAEAIHRARDYIARAEHPGDDWE
ncbi:MAG TPA: hypothetical protein VIC02_03820 [Kineobactrum sp.]